jgi:hypothetical protein
MRRRAPIVCRMYVMARLALLAAVVGTAPSWLGISAALAQGDARTQAREHYASGRRLYEQGEYTGAIREFAAADALAPSGLNDFNIALCHDKLGQPDEAVRFYRSYLTRTPNAANRAQVEATVARLEQQIAAAKAAKDAKDAEDARAAKEAEDARKAAEAAPAPDKAPEQAPVEQAPPIAAPAPATGDAELDRVAAIDVNAIRDQRRGAPSAPPAGAPGPDGAQIAPAGPTAPPAPVAPPPAAPIRPEQPKGGGGKPLYKNPWFWIVAGVATVVLIVVATSDDDGDDFSGVRGLDRPNGPDVNPVPLFRF